MRNIFKSIRKRIKGINHNKKLIIKHFDPKISICYAITTYNEHYELDKLLSHLTSTINLSDEILILADEEKTTEEVKLVMTKYENYISKVIYRSLNNDFASFKNNIATETNKKYIFQLDSDELPHKYLIKNLSSILESNNIDTIMVPRINILTNESIFGWEKYNDDYEKKRINFPDFQSRIYRNTPSIYWINKVHEGLFGFRTRSFLPAETKFCLFHCKTVHKQEKQNELYKNIENNTTRNL